MKTIWAGRAAEAAAKYGEAAPAATACCNACRTCVTSNIFSIVGLLVTGASGSVVRRLKRNSTQP